MKKGITPIISVVILLLITIALAGAAWTFLQGVLLTQVSKAFSVPAGGAYCSGGVIRAVAVNIGSSSLTTSDFVLHRVVSGTGSTAIDREASFATTFGTIQPGKSGTLIEDRCGTTRCAAGVYELTLGTGSNVQHFTVTCT